MLGVSVLAAGLLAGPWMAAAQAAPALPGPVTESVGCNDVTTLNNDIAAADLTKTPTIIYLAPSCVYVLTTNAGGSPDGTRGPVGLFPVTGNVTMVGHLTTIERSATATGPFRIAEVSGPGAMLTIEGITLRGGVAGGGRPSPGKAADGGCLLAFGGEPASPTIGGLLGARLILRDSKLINCDASDGGAIYLAFGSSAYLYKTDVLDSAAAAQGGGLYLESGASARIVTSYIAGNDATTNGGGIYTAGSLTLTGSTLTRNYGGADGGAVYTASGQTSLQGSNLLYNAAGSDGGGLAAIGGSASVEFSIIEMNDAQGDGGGIWAGGGSVWLLNSFVARNLPENCAPGGAVRGCYL
ncbi:MAG: hypothetical protein ACYCVZ_14050 [Streptosporangiaceae bacterium]